MATKPLAFKTWLASIGETYDDYVVLQTTPYWLWTPQQRLLANMIDKAISAGIIRKRNIYSMGVALAQSYYKRVLENIIRDARARRATAITRKRQLCMLPLHQHPSDGALFQVCADIAFENRIIDNLSIYLIATR